MNAKPVGATGNGGGAAEDYILIRDEKVAGTAGGTFTAGFWHTRQLTTKVRDAGGHASLASSQITLAAGAYKVKARAPAYIVSLHKIKLRNITDGTDLVIGSNAYAAPAGSDSGESFLEGHFTLAAPKILELQHRCQITGNSTGFGNACNLGVIEVYATIEFWKET